MRKKVVMSKEMISEYIRKIHNREPDKLAAYVKVNGQLNDIDYYVEVMKKYYPEDKPNLVIYLGGKDNG